MAVKSVVDYSKESIEMLSSGKDTYNYIYDKSWYSMLYQYVPVVFDSDFIF